MKLRTRLVVIVAVLVAFGLLIASALTFNSLRSFLLDRLDDQLVTVQPLAARVLEAAIQGEPIEGTPIEGPARTLPFASVTELREPDGTLVKRIIFGYDPEDQVNRPDITESVLQGRTEPFTSGSVDDSSYKFRVLVTQLSSGSSMIVAIPMEEIDGTLNRLMFIELFVALGLIALTAVGAWLLIRRELRPVERMTEAAVKIAGGDLTQRVEEGDPASEVGTLGRALNQMLEHIESAFEVQRESEDRLRRFLADASHELRTPLTSIRGYAELFRRGADQRPEDLKVAMRRIEDEATRMGVLVEDLLLLARVDRTRPLEMDPVDISAIAADAAADARALDPERPIELDIPGPVTVKGDEDRLRQAVTNLVSNALSHTPPGASVALGVRTDNGTAIIDVSDEGAGLDDDALEHAFERFWRADPNRSRSSGGVGLGLAIVDAIARAHGGSVSAENRPEGGARFSIHLPVS